MHLLFFRHNVSPTSIVIRLRGSFLILCGFFCYNVNAALKKMRIHILTMCRLWDSYTLWTNAEVARSSPRMT